MFRSLSRKRDYRRLLLRNLVTSLVLYEEIRVTKAKAKALKPLIEHLIFLAKKNDLPARRQLKKIFFSSKALKKVFEVLIPRFKDINSGYVSIYLLSRRLGDAAEMAVLKLSQGKNIEVKDGLEKVLKKEEPKSKIAKR
ncbi:MAG TPA: 50S ribosomal protein L17 [Patescibacteria group bacterium]|nr:50S ribosomal protein L17 [Patescibacteria group bacterium]